MMCACGHIGQSTSLTFLPFYVGKETDYEIPDGITAIADYAFFACEDLQSLTIPASVQSIGECACLTCVSLNRVCYKGTIAQWNKVDITFGWLSDRLVSEIICSDGVAAN